MLLAHAKHACVTFMSGPHKPSICNCLHASCHMATCRFQGEVCMLLSLQERFAEADAATPGSGHSTQTVPSTDPQQPGHASMFVQAPHNRVIDTGASSIIDTAMHMGSTISQAFNPEVCCRCITSLIQSLHIISALFKRSSQRSDTRSWPAAAGLLGDMHAFAPCIQRPREKVKQAHAVMWP